MLQLSYLRDHAEEAIEKLKVRNLEAEETITKILQLDKEVREAKQTFDSLKAEANTAAKKIGELFKQGKGENAQALKERSTEIKEETKQIQEKQSALDAELQELLCQLPNVPNPLVPSGNTDADNEVVEEAQGSGQVIEDAKPHWELADKYRLIDFEMGTKVTGAGFPFYRGKGAQLQRSLINFFLSEAAKAGYTEYQPPLLVNEASGFGTGQLPDKEGQMYHVTADDLYLIPTAEVPITNIFRDVILQPDELPVKATGYTPCFRREAGSYGKDVRGLNRLHQFDKVEIVQIAHPDNSYNILQEMLDHAKGLLDKLGLKYRVVRLCGGDLGFTSALTYDLEVYSYGQDRWLEVSSVSNFETFQANRLKVRFKNEEGKSELCHTLNGSALALPRVLAAILEQYQQEDGILVPDVLQPFMGISKIA